MDRQRIQCLCGTQPCWRSSKIWIRILGPFWLCCLAKLKDITTKSTTITNLHEKTLGWDRNSGTDLDLTKERKDLLTIMWFRLSFYICLLPSSRKTLFRFCKIFRVKWTGRGSLNGNLMGVVPPSILQNEISWKKIYRRHWNGYQLLYKENCIAAYLEKSIQHLILEELK